MDSILSTTMDKDRAFETHFRFPWDVWVVLILSLAVVAAKNLVARPAAAALVSRVDTEGRLEAKTKRKFAISLWKAMFYSFMSLYGYIVLRNEPWAYGIKDIMRTWGVGNTPWTILFYYHLEFSYYFVELFYLFSEHMYKDFLQMVLHHLITLHLLFMSYHTDMLRCGVVIMAIHDISDPFLEIGKLVNYTSNTSLATGVFVCFATIFIVSRNVIYTFFVSLPIGAAIYNHKPGLSLLSMAIMLQGLATMHVIWSWMIIRMARRISLGSMGEGKPADASDIKCK